MEVYFVKGNINEKYNSNKLDGIILFLVIFRSTNIYVVSSKTNYYLFRGEN